FAVMYFLIFRPQAKKQKRQTAMIGALQKGDKVVTSGGIYGTIVGIKENEKTLLIEIAEKIKIKITRSSIARKVE
ncbi:preprotein translocase subunit YajC, partial [candidate division KSB1 bacterium]|nr:preprotein translocase subunit YajC [candidate division KSB1 bacterium]